MESPKVVVARKWHSPQIEITINDEKVQIEMQMTDFIKAMVKEIGNPTTLFTVASLEKALTTAATAVVTQMKAETRQVI